MMNPHKNNHNHGSHDHTHHDCSHSHHGHDHSHHDHGPHPDMEKELCFQEKLSILFHHWIEHNNSHKDNYISWAEKAENENLPDTAALLMEAGAASDLVTVTLEKALKSIQNK